MNNFVLIAIAVILGLSSCQRDDPPKEGTASKHVTASNGAAMVAEAKAMLDAAKQKLMEEGKYGCCIRHSCDYCALHESSCDCYEDLREGKHVCIECYSGWQRGDGAVENVGKDQVKTDFVKHEH